MVSHLRSARLWGRDTALLYIHRPGRDVYVDEIRELAPSASVHTRRGEFSAELTMALADQPFGTHLYVCAQLVACGVAAAEGGAPSGRGLPPAHPIGHHPPLHFVGLCRFQCQGPLGIQSLSPQALRPPHLGFRVTRPRLNFLAELGDPALPVY